MGTDESEEVEPLYPTADKRFADNFRTRREEMGLSQTEVAERMSKEFGHPFHQQTVGKIERGTRSVRVSEAVALARIVDTTVDMLTFPSRATLDARELFFKSRKARRLYEELVDGSKELLTLQADLAYRVESASRLDEADDSSSTVAMNIRRARSTLPLTPDAALTKAIQELSTEAIHARDDRDVDREMGVPRQLLAVPSFDRLTWFGVRLNWVLSSLVHNYRRLWRDPRTFLARHLVMVAALNEGGYSVEEIADLINDEPESVERMISDGKVVLEERLRYEEHGDEEDVDLLRLRGPDASDDGEG